MTNRRVSNRAASRLNERVGLKSTLEKRQSRFLIGVMAMSIGVYDWQRHERCGGVLLANGFLARPE
jgi:hypothetical protein